MEPIEEPTRSKKPFIVIVVLLLIFAGAYVFVLNAYKNEGANRAAELTPDTQKAGENRVDVSGRIVSADVIKGDVVLRLEFTPKGSFLSADGATLARDLDLYISSATGKNVHEFKKGKRMSPVEAIPTAVELRGSVAGLRIDTEYAKENTPDHTVIEISLQRATTAVFFSIFIMIAMWALTFGVIFLVYRVFAGHRKIEISMFSFLGALLFAFPALRNSQPGTPPIGTLSDFIAFFWAEVIIALSLLSVVICWLVRGPGGEAKK